MQATILPTLHTDPQEAKPASFCPLCGGERYAPGEHCLRCERNSICSMEVLSREYAHSAEKLKVRLRQLRRQLAQAPTPREAERIRRRILTLTPMLTEMRELRQLTAHYYDRGYYRDKKYTF